MISLGWLAITFPRIWYSTLKWLITYEGVGAGFVSADKSDHAHISTILVRPTLCRTLFSSGRWVP